MNKRYIILCFAFALVVFFFVPYYNTSEIGIVLYFLVAFFFLIMALKRIIYIKRSEKEDEVQRAEEV